MKSKTQHGAAAQHAAAESRRGFIKNLALAGGAAAAAPASVVVAQPTRAAPAPTRAKGYQNSAHNRRYYSLARQI